MTCSWSLLRPGYEPCMAVLQNTSCLQQAMWRDVCGEIRPHLRASSGPHASCMHHGWGSAVHCFSAPALLLSPCACLRGTMTLPFLLDKWCPAPMESWTLAGTAAFNPCVLESLWMMLSSSLALVCALLNKAALSQAAELRCVAWSCAEHLLAYICALCIHLQAQWWQGGQGSHRANWR
jgi:hypothetical protein